MSDPFATINLDTLENVTGGRYQAASETIKPELIQAISQLAEAVTGIGQANAQTKEKQFTQMMQLFQQMRGGGQ